MVAGSRLNMDWNITPPLPTLCSAEIMNVFGEYSLSAPRGPDCCVSTMNACPMSIRFHDPRRGMSIGIGHDGGFKLVPDAMFMRNMPAAFICIPWLIPGISMGSCPWLSWGTSSAPPLSPVWPNAAEASITRAWLNTAASRSHVIMKFLLYLHTEYRRALVKSHVGPRPKRERRQEARFSGRVGNGPQRGWAAMQR